MKTRLIALGLLILGGLLGWFVYSTQVGGISNTSRFAFKLGLDLRGGTHLTYQADLSQVAQTEVKDSMTALRDVIERRINLFGVSEPVVQVQTSSAVAGGAPAQRLIVELPGVTDLDQAIALIGATPQLDFRLPKPDAERVKILDEYRKTLGVSASSTLSGVDAATMEKLYTRTPLTGRYLEKAALNFDQTTGRAVVLLTFNAEGTKLFADITKANIDKIVSIFLDGVPISEPIVQEEITTGSAQISGGSNGFAPQEAKLLVGRLNSGALPVPITLVSTQKIGASLGADALQAGLMAGLYGFIALALFLLFWYRLPGVIAIVALCLYVVISLSIFKLGVVLTSAGIAGFILSIGMAVDANILIFERTKEELGKGLPIDKALHAGFSRAWPSIRDSNISSLITASVLFWIGTSLVKGFALTFGLGVLVSMFTAISVTRTSLFALDVKDNSIMKFLFSNGLGK